MTTKLSTQNYLRIHYITSKELPLHFDGDFKGESLEGDFRENHFVILDQLIAYPIEINNSKGITKIKFSHQ